MAKNIEQNMLKMAAQAKAASKILARASANHRSLAIEAIADALNRQKDEILRANKQDLEQASANKVSAAFIDRMSLSPQRLDAVVQTLRDIALQLDPVGREMESWVQPNGLQFSKISVPLGVIGIIYESRPNVTADAAALCLRSGNAVILRGGSDALASSRAIFAAIQEGLRATDMPEGAVQLVDHTDRSAVGFMLQGLKGQLDLVIPRGGKSLVSRIQRDARVPVLSHLDGICHVYVHKDANPEMAVQVVLNSKMRRVGICGAAECLLVDDECAAEILPKIVDALHDAGCELRADDAARKIDTRMKTASADDWGREFLAPILAVRLVRDLDEAVAFIEKYGSGHTDAIITDNQQLARQFQAQVDSAIVLHNASTQFADGGEFGFGAEIGIATGKLHARGPVGAMQLTSYKYLVSGNGQKRAE